jgi:ApbE superfamily uncharacterized protein (UPF0280 family)
MGVSELKQNLVVVSPHLENGISVVHADTSTVVILVGSLCGTETKHSFILHVDSKHVCETSGIRLHLIESHSFGEATKVEIC